MGTKEDPRTHKRQGPEAEVEIPDELDGGDNEVGGRGR